MGWTIEPILYLHCNGEHNSPDIILLYEDSKELFNKNRALWYFEVHAWSLPSWCDKMLYEWLVAQMRNYILHHVLNEDYNLRYYRPTEDHVITDDG